jgi:hypothetical protein
MSKKEEVSGEIRKRINPGSICYGFTFKAIIYTHLLISTLRTSGNKKRL